ncbi:unnamed protein product [Brassica oleracea]
MDELWYPDPKAFANMTFGSDHLLLFSRTWELTTNSSFSFQSRTQKEILLTPL